MNNLSTPPVPELGSDWIAVRRSHLVRELAPPARRRVSRRLALRGTGALAAVGASTAAVFVAFVGAGAPNAFAGWTATPTRPANGETAGALAQCTSRIAGAAGDQSGIPAGSWQSVLTDTRGPFTAMILQNGSATATCLAGPSFTTIAANAAQDGASQHVVSSSSATAGRLNGRPKVSILGLGASASGPITQASEQQLAVSGQPYTFLQGQVRAGVTGVTVVLSDGTDVQATVADGSLVAWWPGSAHAIAAHATSGSGVTTQQLTFTTVSPTNLPALGNSQAANTVTRSSSSR